MPIPTQKRFLVSGFVLLLCLAHAALIMIAPLAVVFSFVTAEILLFIFSKKPEYSVVVFAIDSFIKNLPFVPEFFGFNPTILFFAMSLLFLITYFIREHNKFHFQLDSGMIFLTGFLVVLILGNFYTASPAWALEKSSRFLIFNLFALLAPLFFVGEPQRLERILLGIIFFGGVISVYALSTELESFNQGHVRLSFFGANPIAFAQLSALSLILIVFRLNHWPGSRLKFLLVLPIPLLVLALIFSNSNGPVLASLLTFVICFLFISKMTLPRRMMWLAITLTLFIVLYAMLPTTYVYRYTGLIEGGFQDASSASSRLIRWDTAIHAFMDSPIIGVGTGGFAALTDAEQDYPHNLFLELLSEHGLVGFACMAIFLGIVLFRAHQNISNENLATPRVLLIPIFAGTIFLLLAAQISGSLLDLRLLFLFLGMMIALQWGRAENRLHFTGSTSPDRSANDDIDEAVEAVPENHSRTQRAFE